MESEGDSLIASRESFFSSGIGMRFVVLLLSKMCVGEVRRLENRSRLGEVDARF